MEIPDTRNSTEGPAEISKKMTRKINIYDRFLQELSAEWQNGVLSYVKYCSVAVLKLLQHMESSDTCSTFCKYISEIFIQFVMINTLSNGEITGMQCSTVPSEI
jgi:hypothetical protein